MTTRAKTRSTQAVKTPTMQDVADKVGVGKTTVSLVFNGKGNISPKTRSAVFRTAQRMGFSPNPHARRLSNGGSEQTIGLFVPNVFAGTGAARVQIIQQLLQAKGFDAPLYTYGSTGPTAGAPTALLQSVARQKPRAMICTAGTLCAGSIDAGLRHPEVLRAIRSYQNGGGIVTCYGLPMPLECDQIVFDYEGSAYLAARHLLELGHRRVGLFCSSLEQAPHIKGFRRALKEYGIEADKNWLFDGPAYEPGGMALAKMFLDLKPQQRPTALCIVNDVTASAFINQLLRAGLRVPKDVSVVGFDDTPAAAACIVPMTVIRQPVETIARAVVDVLIERLDGEKEKSPIQIVIEGEPVIRDSTAEYST